MKAISPPALILLERSGRWAASLRRQGMVDRLALVEARSLAELDELASSCPQALIGLELTSTSAERVLAWLGRKPHAAREKSSGFAERCLRPYELLCREAGAVHFIASELELFSLPAIFDRYLSQPVFAKLDEAKQPLADRIRSRLPW